MSSAPSRPSSTSGASPCLNIFSSLRLASRSCVKRFQSLALNLKSRVEGDFLHPTFHHLGAQRGVKSGVDFYGVKELRKVGGLMKTARLVVRVDDSLPIGVRPTGGSDQDARFRGRAAHVRLFFVI